MNQIKIAAYLRVSTDRQAKDNFSLQDQEDSIKKWAKENNALIVQVFRDEGKSGFSGVRPAFKNMLEQIKTGELVVDLVVAYNLSRIARNERDRLEACHILEQAGARFHSLMEPTPEDSDQAWMLSSFQGTMNEMQSRHQSKLAATKLNKYAELGFHTGGICPYGYTTSSVNDTLEGRTRKILVTFEDEAKIVREIYDLALNGTDGNRFGVKRIASYLNDRGIKRRGKLWTSNNIHRTLTDTIYYGERRFGKLRKRKDLHSEVVVQSVPAIIDKSIYSEVAKLLNHFAPQKNNHQALISPALLTGLAVCSNCGSPMLINTGKSGRYKYYKCRQRATCSINLCDMRQIPKDTLEHEVVNELRDKILTFEEIQANLNAIKEAVSARYKEIDKDLFVLNSRKAKLKTEYQNLISMMAKGNITSSEFINQSISQYESDLRRIDREIDELRDIVRLPIRKFGRAQTNRFIDAARKVLLNPQHHACKGLLNALVSKIEVKKDQVSLKGSKLKLMGVISAYENGHSEFRVPTHISIWRRERDSNPRYVAVYTLSRRAPSATRTPLQNGRYGRGFSRSNQGV